MHRQLKKSPDNGGAIAFVRVRKDARDRNPCRGSGEFLIKEKPRRRWSLHLCTSEYRRKRSHSLDWNQRIGDHRSARTATESSPLFERGKILEIKSFDPYQLVAFQERAQTTTGSSPLYE